MGSDFYVEFFGLRYVVCGMGYAVTSNRIPRTSHHSPKNINLALK